MSQVSEMVEVQERLYTLRDEMARRPAAGKKKTQAAQPQGKLADRRLQQIEAGLYPTCEVCGERIEMDRLREDPIVPTCYACARRHPSASP